MPAGFEEFNYHRLPGKGLTVQDLTETVEAMPMMAQHTLVVVTDMDLFRLDEGQRGLLIELLGDFPEYCTLVFVYDVLAYKRDRKMKKLCAAIGDHVQEVEFCQQEREQLLRWMKRRFAAEGHDIDIAAADHLLFTCGTLMTDLVPEIGKIAAYAKSERITIADINAVADPILDAQVFDMTNSITAGKYDDAARVLGELLRMQTEPIVILAAVGKELRRLYTARMALDGGADGLDFYRAVTQKWKSALRLGGSLIFEVGIGQAPSVEDILARNGFEGIQTTADTQGIWRVVEGTVNR